jgi:hypothetical protein
MFNISHFLEKIRGIQAKSAFERIIVHNVILKNIGIDIPIENVSIKSTVITLKNISQSAKSAIYIKKLLLLEDINKNQNNIIAKDIRY